MADTESAPNADQTSDADAKRSLLRRLLDRAPTGRKRIVLAGAAALGVAAVLGGMFFLHDAEIRVQAASLEMALATLDDGRYPEARKIAEELADTGALSPEANSGKSFVLGAVMIAEAKGSWTDETAKYMLAAKHLENSRDRGFPAGRDAQGYFLLGEALHDSGQFVQSRRWLREALHADPRMSKDLNRLLSSSYRNDPNPKWSQALEHNTEWLADRGLTPRERNEALLERSQLLYELGQIDACREALAEMSIEAGNRAEATLMRGRLVLDDARKETITENGQSGADDAELAERTAGLFEQAIQLFRESQGQDTLNSNTSRKAMYLIGVCLAEMDGRREAAIDQLARTRRIYPETPEAVAAGLLEGDLRRDALQMDEAASAYRDALRAAGDPLVYSNSWVPLDEFIRRITEAYQALLEGEYYAQALAMLDDFPPLFDVDETVDLKAKTEAAWGASLLKEAKRLPPSQRDPVEESAREHWIKAGYGFSDLARLHTTSREYPEDIWRSGQAFSNGQDFINASRVLAIYLKNETRQHQPAAQVAFAKASLAQGKTDQAIMALRACIDFHSRDAAVYEARIWCAKAYRDKRQFDEAEELLVTNLRLSGLTPASPEWRESLYEYGFLLHENGRYTEAIETLQEAVDRERLLAGGDDIPYSPQVVRAMYAIADAYRRRADEPRERLITADVESDRLAMQRQLMRTLDMAADQYIQLRALLNRRQELFELTELDQSTLRNCYFFLGGVLFDMERYEDAIKAYSDAEARYQNDPLVLEIHIQVASCYTRMNRTTEARGAIERAKVVLNQFPPDAPFLASTNYSREEWRDLLDQLSKW